MNYDSYNIQLGDQFDSLPTKIDLSTEYYVPKAIFQDGGTCTSCSSIYYQYSYEVNRMKGITPSENGLVFSPYYIFSYAFADKKENYNQVMERGCINWNEWIYERYSDVTGRIEKVAGELNDGPLYDCKDVTAMRNALNTRIAHYYEYVIGYKDNENNNYDKLNEIKALLANGYMLVTGINADLVNEDELGQLTKEVYRVGRSESNHAITIVGYDDRKTFTYNLENQKNPADSIITEWGGFKVRNSWGTGFHDNGEFWVPYSAVINDVSNVKTSDKIIEGVPDITLRKKTEAEKNNKDDNGYYIFKKDNSKVPAEVIEVSVADLSLPEFLEEMQCLPKDENGKQGIDDFRNKVTEIYGVGEGNDRTLTEESQVALNVWFSNNKTIWKAELDKFDSGDANYKLPANWDEVLSCYLGSRQRVFSDYMGNFNDFYLIQVEEKDVQLVGQVDYTLANCSDYKLTFSKVGGTSKIMPNRKEKDNSLTTTEVFDLTELLSNNSIANVEGQWKVTLATDNKDNYRNLEFKLTEKDGRVIPTILVSKKTYTDTSTKKTVTEFIIQTDFQCGDNDYDGYLTVRDFQSFFDRYKGIKSENLLQEKLYDCNRDGSIDANDLYDMLYAAYQGVYSNESSYVKMTKGELYDLLSTLGYSQIGDVTLDGRIDNKDVKMLMDMLRGEARNSLQKILGDVDRDGQLRWSDYRKLANELYYIDVNQNGLYTEEDINEVFYHIAGIDTLPVNQQRLVDFDGDGIVEREEYYMLIYGYYLNIDMNPYFSRSEFYNDFLPAKEMKPGNLSMSGGIDETDLQLFKNALSGNAGSYIHLVLADVNKDLKLDEEDARIFESNYMSDIPFTYTLDTTSKTMTLTGAKDKNITCLKIAKEYTVNCVKYQVTMIANNAFSDCDSLDEIYIPATVTKIAPASYTKSPFYGISSSSFIIYYEGESRPAGFTKCWEGQKIVKYGYTMKNIKDYFYYTADETSKTLTITGIKGEWYYDTDMIVDIDDRYLLNGEEYQVTAIGDYAFKGNYEITDIYLPAGVTVIGKGAFSNMSYLEFVDMTRCVNLKTIKASAFAYSYRLDTVWMLGSVKVIESSIVEESIFYQCPEDLYTMVLGSYSIAGWGKYWNYIDESTVADTQYFGAPYSQ